MRLGALETITELAETDPRIIFMTGDLGFTVVERFRERFPERFFNVGVAEQNMIGMATGLAEAGFVPFVYSITAFTLLRPYEFIRNGPVLHGLPVRILGVGAGFDYGSAGPTHHGLEDLAVARAQPGLTIVAPADHRQARAALRTTWDLPGPVYYRLGKDDHSTVAGLDGDFDIERLGLIGSGRDVLLVATGAITEEVDGARRILAEQGIDASIAVVASFNPGPDGELADLLGTFRAAVTIEEHYRVGGLGSFVAETLTDTGHGARLLRVGIAEPADGVCGSRGWLLERQGLDAASIARRVAAFLAGDESP